MWKMLHNFMARRRAIAADLDIVSISKRQGRASPALTLSVYSHMFKNKDRAAADAIDAAFQRAIR